MSKRLNQIIAIKKSLKQRNYAELTALYQSSQKPDPFYGFTKVFKKKTEDGEDFPPERKKVQITAGSVLQRVRALLTELWDTEATIDIANCSAKADVELDGVLLITQAPTTHLLYLEKSLQDLWTTVSKMPVLSEDDNWEYDSNAGLFKTDEVMTHRTKKVQKALVLYQATEKHPAQTQLITDDEIVGYWSTVKMSGALPVPYKQKLLARIAKLKDAVKQAREKANEVAAEPVFIGDKIFNYLFQE